MKQIRIGFFLLLLLLLTISPTNAEGEWYAEYFANRTLSGGPTVTRYENGPHLEWGTGSPADTIPADDFSVRLTRDEWFEGGTYRFSYRSDDGIRVWVGDRLVVDDWRDRQYAWDFVEHYIPAGVHRVRIEYYEHNGGAALHVAWEKASAGAMWFAEYYNNRDLSGESVLARHDTAVDFDWGSGSPHVLVPEDRFSVRWSRTLGFEAGTYRFYASCDDGVRIFVDGNIVVDAWHKQELPNTRSGDIHLSAGQHSVVVEYFEEGGVASAHAWWNRLDTIGGWEGRYFDNRELRGGPAMIRDDAEINFDWGEGPPADWIPSDNFSAIWTRTINFKPGLYRFNVRADDGFRLWLDETELRMDYWLPQDFAWHYQDWHYLEGTHALKLEYFEQAGHARVQLWWNYAATIEAARAMKPSPTYGFSAAPAVAPKPVPKPKPMPTKPTTSAPLPGPWQAEYFNGRDLEKAPVIVRSDDSIDFNWGWESPAPEIPVNQFAARWTATPDFEAGRYRFTTISDDGIRVYVDDDLVINSWRRMRGTRTAVLDLDAGAHTVRVEYFEATQAASVYVTWARIGNTTSAASPTQAPTPKAASKPEDDEGMLATWDIRYYDNADLSGEPVVTKATQTTALDFDWGYESPDPSVPEDRFSASFETTQDFEAGSYRFTTTSDDGVRLYVDDTLVINSWRPMRGLRYKTLELTQGTHTIRLEYFERSGLANVTLKVQEQ